MERAKDGPERSSPVSSSVELENQPASSQFSVQFLSELAVKDYTA